LTFAKKPQPTKSFAALESRNPRLPNDNMVHVANAAIFLFSPFLSLQRRLDFYGFRHKLVTPDFEAFRYFFF
jgi:hypothetical protein